VTTVLKSGSLNLLEFSGPVQACNGIDFFFFAFTNYYHFLLQIITTFYYKLLPLFITNCYLFLFYYFYLQVTNALRDYYNCGLSKSTDSRIYYVFPSTNNVLYKPQYYFMSCKLSVVLV